MTRAMIIAAPLVTGVRAEPLPQPKPPGVAAKESNRQPIRFHKRLGRPYSLLYVRAILNWNFLLYGRLCSLGGSNWVRQTVERLRVATQSAGGTVCGQ